jgi:putative glutathione S-transferase
LRYSEIEQALTEGELMTGGYVEDDFDRDTDYIEDRITEDGRDGWPV